MKNNQDHWQTPDNNNQEENHRVGRELYRRDQDKNQRHQPDHNRQQPQRWDMGNNFHTGPNQQSRSHFPEDNQQRNTNADWGGSRDKHYGERNYSVYRNDNSLNYGDGRGNNSKNQQHQQEHPFSGQQNQNYSAFGDGRGNYSARQDSDGRGYGNDRIHSENISQQRRRDDSNENYYKGAYMDDRGVKKEKPRPEDNPYNEYPGSRSRYKDDDYRYGSGNHGWREDQRYTDNNGRRVDRDKGDIINEMGAGVREVWHDIKNTFSSSNDNDQDRRRHDDNRGNRHEQEYRSRRDQGTERGPRWSDETDSGDDSFFYSDGRNPRYY